MKLNTYAEVPLNIAKRKLVAAIKHAARTRCGVQEEAELVYAVDKIAEAAVAEVMVRLRTAGLYWCPICEQFRQVDEAAGAGKMCAYCFSSLDGAPY